MDSVLMITISTLVLAIILIVITIAVIKGKQSKKYKENIKDAVNNGVFFLLICGSYQLFGKYYKGVEGNIIPGLEVFDYYTEALADRKKRCIGNVVINVNLNGKDTKIIGFGNHRWTNI